VKLSTEMERLSRDLRDLLILAEQKMWEIQKQGFEFDLCIEIGQSHYLYCDLMRADFEKPFIIKGPNAPLETELT